MTMMEVTRNSGVMGVPDSVGEGTDDADASARAVARLRFHRDVDVQAERGEQAHQAVTREVGEPAVQQGGDLRLVDAHQRGGGRLRQAAAPDGLPDMAGKLRLGEFLLWLGKAQAVEDVAAAGRYRDFGFSVLDHCS